MGKGKHLAAVVKWTGCLLLLCIMIGVVISCGRKTQDTDVQDGQENNIEMPAISGQAEDSIDGDTAGMTEKAEGMTDTSEDIDIQDETPEEKADYAEWIYDAGKHRLTVRGTGETHDREWTEPTDCGDCKYHADNLPYLSEVSSSKKLEKIRQSIQEVVIEQGITALNMAAFADLPNMQKITIPDSVEKIDDYAFYGCESLEEITLPDSIISMGVECFGECSSLKKIQVPDSVISMEQGCFSGCKTLETVSFGKKIEKIGEGIFGGCKSLRNISIAPENLFFQIKNGGFYSEQEKVLYFQYDCSGNVTVEKGTKRIGSFAFSGHNTLQEVHIPASVNAIGGASFYQCKNLKTVTFAKDSQCKTIESYRNKTDVYGCFEGCSKLAGISFPKSLRSIDTYGLKDCVSLKKVRFPEEFQYISSGCFEGCASLEKLYFGRAFRGDLYYTENLGLDVEPGEMEDAIMSSDMVSSGALKEIRVSGDNPVFSTEDGVMYDKKKEILYAYPERKRDTAFQVPDSVRKIRVGAFSGCNQLRSVEIPGSKTAIQPSAFYACSNLKSVAIYGDETALEEEAFYKCRKLNEVFLYGEKMQIPSGAFKQCKNIKSVTIYGMETMPETKAFGKSRSFTVYGKAGSDAQKFAEKYRKKFVVIS